MCSSAESLCVSSATDPKTCTKCQQTKPLAEFPQRTRGHYRECCKICHRAANRRSRIAHREARNAYSRAWAARNPERIHAAQKASFERRTDAQKRARTAWERNWNLKRKYGIDVAEFNAMLVAQNGVCALCRVPGRVGKHDKLAVDHDHKTGRVRGLLCSICNSALATLGDGEVGLQHALEYVRRSGV